MNNNISYIYIISTKYKCLNFNSVFEGDKLIKRCVRNTKKNHIVSYRAGEPEPEGAACFWPLGAGAA